MAKAKDTKQPDQAPKARKQADWEAIESDYRAGVLSLREMAAAHGVSHVAIKKHADRYGWTRDLSEKIKERANALVNSQAVTTQVNGAASASERLIIEANAQRIAQVRGEHRGDIQRLRTHGLNLLAELEQQTVAIEDLQKLGELLRSENEQGRDALNDLYHKIISTPGRVDAAKKVAETLRHAIGLEREAYGLDEPDQKPKPKPPALASIPPGGAGEAYRAWVHG